MPVEPVFDEEEEEVIEEEIRGHAPIVDPAELAFVFSVDGVSYLRLSTEERASASGRPRLIEEEGMHAVVAPVTTAAMPEGLRAWAGRSVLVDGSCRARVAGFAEVSRVTGEAADPYDDDLEADPRRPPAGWTVEAVVDTGVVLAARLDGCAGTWARSEDFAPAALVTTIDAPALEAAARADLLSRATVDLTQKSWAEDGGTGDWRDAAEVVTLAVHHPLTNENWVFVQARRDGSCGDPGFALMAAYRSNEDGTVRRVADLSFGSATINEVVDLDGDGQPEIILGGGDHAELVDLANEQHDSIDVPERSYGCGC